MKKVKDGVLCDSRRSDASRIRVHQGVGVSKIIYTVIFAFVALVVGASQASAVPVVSNIELLQRDDGSWFVQYDAAGYAEDDFGPQFWIVPAGQGAPQAVAQVSTIAYPDSEYCGPPTAAVGNICEIEVFVPDGLVIGSSYSIYDYYMTADEEVTGPHVTTGYTASRYVSAPAAGPIGTAFAGLGGQLLVVAGLAIAIGVVVFGLRKGWQVLRRAT